MTRKIIIRLAAEDLEEASAWYEKQRIGLGKEFLASVDETLEKLKHWPDFGIVVYKQLCRANVQRFPYDVFYQVGEDRIIVVGILHGRRAPRRWKSRLE